MHFALKERHCGLGVAVRNNRHLAVAHVEQGGAGSHGRRLGHSSAGEKPGVQDFAQSDIAGSLNGNRFY